MPAAPAAPRDGAPRPDEVAVTAAPGSKRVLARVVTWLVIFGLAALKLWLVSDQTLRFRGQSDHDSALFVKLAGSLLEGEWLGPYDRFTLIKGPGYPIWIAAMHVLGVPLLWARQWLYVLACIALTTALRRVLASPFVWVPLLALLLFNPVTFDPGTLIVSREGFYASVTGAVLAGLACLHHARRGAPIVMALWAVVLGAAFALFWVTREEGLWLLPAFLTLPLFTLWSVWRGDPADRRVRMGLCLLPYAVCGLGLGAVMTLNQQRYGIRCVTELGTPQFGTALGTLQRVEPHERKQAIPVPAATRKRLYEVSPSFKRLEPFLEGSAGNSWKIVSRRRLGLTPDEADIGGGWFVWAFREAADLAGMHQVGPGALAFYDGLSRELSEALDDGRLSGTMADTLAPPWHPSYGPQLLARVVEGAVFLGTFSRVGTLVYRPASTGTDEHLAQVEELIGAKLWYGPGPAAPELGLPPDALPDEQSGTPSADRPDEATNVVPGGPDSGARKNARRVVSRIYRLATPTLSGAAVLAFLVTCLLRLRRRALSFLFVLNASLVACVIVRTALLAFIDLASFPAITHLYFLPSYVLLLLFHVTAPGDLVALLRSRRQVQGDVHPQPSAEAHGV